MRDVRGNPLRMDLTGKRVVVTGATAGIGRELARVFASQGAKVGLAVRDVAKGEALQRELGGQVEVLLQQSKRGARPRRCSTCLRGRSDLSEA